MFNFLRLRHIMCQALSSLHDERVALRPACADILADIGIDEIRRDGR